MTTLIAKPLRSSLQAGNLTALTTPRAPRQGVSVAPNEPESKSWIEENTALASVIIIGGFILIVILFFCWLRFKRKRAESKELKIVDSNVIEETNDETASSASHSIPTPEPRKSLPDIYSDSFVIIRSPSMSKRRESKTKKPVAVHPLFSVNQRKPSGPNPNQRRATVHVARWSEEGLEIRAAGVLAEKQRARTASASAAIERERAKAIDSETPRKNSAGNADVPKVVYRRVSLGPHHAIYAPKLKPPTSDESSED